MTKLNIIDYAVNVIDSIINDCYLLNAFLTDKFLMFIYSSLGTIDS